MGVYWGALMQVIPLFIYVALLVFFVWAANKVVKQLNRIEALLSDIRERLPELEDARGKRI